jgi:hypothetical protein
MRKHNIIFLDFDGVLTDFVSRKQKSVDLIDRGKVNLLNQIVAANQANVVVTSYYRLRKDTKTLQRFLDSHGFEGEVIGKLEDPDILRPRWEEIDDWILSFNESIRAFIIIDDDEKMEPHKNKFLRTDFKFGLVHEDVQKAKLLFEKQLKKSTTNDPNR